MPDEHDPLDDLLRNDTPRDIVPRTGLTREDILKANNMAGKEVTITEPGEVVCDPDGIPIGVTQATTRKGVFTSLTITSAELHRAGLTKEEVPNVNVI